MTNKLKILIVEESPDIQRMLSDIVNADPNMSVVGVASDPYIAREKIKILDPDILTLDVELPKMDGITFLRNIMRLRPMPVLMVVGDRTDALAMMSEAKKIGAKGFVIKTPLLRDPPNERDKLGFLNELRKAGENIGTPKAKHSIDCSSTEECHSADVILDFTEHKNPKSTERIIAMGASTGGTEAIRNVLVELPSTMPGIVIAQHIPGSFSGAFADRVNRVASLNVTEAKDGEKILPGHVYIAPGGQHLVVEAIDSGYRCTLDDGPPVNRHKPSVDVLFRSVAQSAGHNAIGVLLTGMGSDGAAGLLQMKQANAPTIVQDEATSVVWGMPGSAVNIGAADEILPLDKIAVQLVGKLKTQEITDKVKEFALSRRFNT